MAFNKLNLSKFFGMTDDEFDDQANTQEKVNGSQQPNERTTGKSSVNNRQKVVSMNAAPAKASKIVIFEPRIYSDVKEAASHLLNSRAVVISFNRIDQTQAKRIVDFLTGTVFAINGDIERIGDDIFLCTPANFEIDGNLSDILRQDGLG
ncbi:cell division protein SepF [Loigolactobacillus rennini]|uniref:Cell division protein SepF n=1 Tax=Loigolactobacillus rennini DSM 20253 TaxID=1423796 RepID=A0A0R2D0T7_9LACO|nr:cell division protein SepF [Loigolactobacillus rennini]KRM97122.1 cell division protein sepF [Loigolactobacillus rennini DSM 20253]